MNQILVRAAVLLVSPPITAYAAWQVLIGTTNKGPFAVQAFGLSCHTALFVIAVWFFAKECLLFLNDFVGRIRQSDDRRHPLA